jgi:phosphomannomutase
MDPFKAYDIRGLYPQELNEALAYQIGQATAVQLGLAGRRFTVGRDMRLSGPALKQAFSSGLVDAGVIVVDVGMCSTPALTFAMHHLGTEGGAMITASHNPSPYGGIKITGPGWVPIAAGSGMEAIETLARSGKRHRAPGGRIEEALILDAYASFLAPLVRLARPLRVVVDGGNGIIGTIFQHMLPRVGQMTLIPMHFDPDGRFPAHDANPLKAENRVGLQARVRAERADFGAAFDGDGDRCALVDEHGGIVPCDIASALLAQYFLALEPGATIAYDLRSSQVVPEWIREHGGIPVETRVGHSFIKQTMKEHHAIFAGELSGHYYFRDFFGADSGMYAFLLLANLISQSTSLSAAVAPLQRYHQSGEINFTVSDVAAVLERVRRMPGARISELDGVTVRFEGWWANVRASNTEPVIRLNLEAATPADRDARVAQLRDLIQAS